MSVTFSVTMTHDEPVAWNLTCETLGLLTPEPLPWERATEVATEHKAVCVEDVCRYYGPDKDMVRLAGVRTDLDVNLANHNARFVLDALGINTDEDLCGTLPADDFLGRCMLATAIAPHDAGMPTYVATPADTGHPLAASFASAGATVIMGGRRDGYLQDILVNLTALAEYARTVNRTITWA